MCVLCYQKFIIGDGTNIQWNSKYGKVEDVYFCVGDDKKFVM
jgi:hypothetical protein